MKKTIGILLIINLLFSCKKEKENINSLKHVGSSFNSKKTKFSKNEAYEKEAVQIIEKGKSRLQNLLPNIINNQISLIKDTFNKTKNSSIRSITLNETDIDIRSIKTYTLDSLINSELKVNKVYFQIINELSILNEKFKKDNSIKLKDYYDIKPFILAEDVLTKIDELITDENQRIEIEKRKKNISLCTSVVAFLPGISGVSKILEKVATTARFARRNIKPGTLTNDVFRNKIAPLFINKISNKTKRNIIEGGINHSIKNQLKNSASSLLNNLKSIDPESIEKTYDYFKSNDNQIRGRIGDFSDGILTQPIANLRKIMKENCKIISENSFTN
ncbi:hypothetical protein Q4595_15970 [Wenyingzhuangia sp. 1_MG-2023]|nr:hypothetical protein [Wenyingzhuangia sp. 1_MG-2023]